MIALTKFALDSVSGVVWLRFLDFPGFRGTRDPEVI